ncbi:hypothetical protein L1887_38278 [Cichorium endivia]|nr:hypothetical protein L1887_38278 [Cichorium endivia]
MTGKADCKYEIMLDLGKHEKARSPVTSLAVLGWRLGDLRCSGVVAVISIFVTLKLSGRDEFGIWKTQMLCLLESYGMLGFIDGTLVSPQTSSNISGKEKVGEHQTHHKLWRRSDALVKGWILGSLSKETLTYVMDRLTKKLHQERNAVDFYAKDLWDELQTMYAPAVVLPELPVLEALHVAVGTSKKPKFLQKLLGRIPEHTQLLDVRNSDGSTLLHVAAIVGNTQATDILVERDRDLLLAKDNEGHTPLAIAISNMHTETSKHLLQFVNTDIEKEALFSGTSGDELLVNVISSKDFGFAKELLQHYTTLHTDAVLMSIAQNFPCELGVVDTIFEKAKVFCCIMLLLMIPYIISVIAAKQNSYEVVQRIVHFFPNAILSANEDGHNVIQYAVINRSEKVYNLLYKMGEHRNMYRTIKDASGNNLLHLAARLAPFNKLNLISGAALQIQRELTWFKSTAKSYTITAALIITIVFAAAITVPGGSNQDTGMPIFINNTAFTIFAISDAISLFAAVTSLLMFLSILTARFAEQDFLLKLPTKLIIGLATLFISTTAMIIAFAATLYLVFGQRNSMILIPIAVLTCLPITLFVTLQFPLVLDLTKATYVRRIFGKRIDYSHWHGEVLI